ELATDFEGKVKIGKLNTDENNSVASQYQIMGIPSLLLYKNGEIVERIVGVVPKEQIEDVLRKHSEMN
ncbi:thioredoxin family protein, partial [candidate division KSB1 bacterium]